MAAKRGERKEALVRLFVGIVTGFILYVWSHVAHLLILFHWIYALIIGKRVKALADFIELWNTTLYRYFAYISGVSRKKPFPFGSLKNISKFEK